MDPLQLCKALFRTVVVDVMIESFITVLRKNIYQNFKVHDNIDIRQLAWLSLTFGKRGVIHYEPRLISGLYGHD